MKSSAAKIQITDLDALFGGAPAQVIGDQLQEVLLAELHPFKGHPFHVEDDEKMREMAESVAQYGVLVPGIVRPRPEGGYEIIAGHRRSRASELAGKETMPVIVRDMDDDEATIIMVDSNLQREKILPSEKAFAYRMKLEAMKRKAGRPRKDNCVPVAHNLSGRKSRNVLAEQVGESQDQIRRYIRLTHLLPPLLQMVDENKLTLRPAVELSYLTQDEQGLLMEMMSSREIVPTLEQAQELKLYSQDNQLTIAKIKVVLAQGKSGPMQVTLKKKCLSQYFPKDYTQKQIEEVILSLLKTWKSQQKGVVTNDSDG
ncbi:ParB/RepB/Spo0J family partition protein [Acutalibacter muris]|jgi:ParB family chromosome partitioning protein|uniref:ParB/RepB/Spo0J family partition protein n=1 Tax=Acutalibacter muris TaxID=1796620 RepID=UPI0026F3CF7B|nr:ParB/RepB/Spo0J family partition protein [Acutalibacter muris]